ncbi:hypothetical protein ACROYT_G012602 [Oculina patagonica]
MFLLLVIVAFMLAQVEKTSAESSFLLDTLNEVDDSTNEITRRECKNLNSAQFCKRFRNGHAAVSEDLKDCR